MAPVPLLLSPRSKTPATDYVVVDYLVVAGGGGGGSRSPNPFDEVKTAGGGGGAGGVLQRSIALLRGGEVQLSVGAGGDSSSLGDLEAIAGGAGGTGGASPGNGSAGGSGGGGAQTQSGTTSGGAGTPGQGVSGQGGTTFDAGDGGGLGTSSAITGASVVYAVGGSPGDGPAPAANTGNGGGGAVQLSGGIIVSGAGQSGANGTYTISGNSFLDSPEYRLAGTDFYIRNNGASWNIVQDDGENPPSIRYTLNNTPADIEFYNPYVGPLPEGPATVFDGASPAPTISNAPSSSTATGGASGVVVVAYPVSLPPLTISGPTYDEPTRAGYRVYRFTAGSGSISIG